MVLAALASLGETLACVPAPDDVDTFEGREVVAWLVSDRTDAELMEVAAAVPEVADAQAIEAVADAAVDGEPETPVAATPAPAPRATRRSHGSSTVRVDAERLDQLMHAMGELVLNRTQVEVLAANADVPGLAQAIQGLTRTSHALQAMVMQVRMIPVEAVLLRFPRLVRDLSVKLSKQVELELIGKDTELDRSVVDSLGDPLVHLIRNSLDHGLETPAERAAAGKPETGKLQIEARHAGGNVVISVKDDGRGIDAERVAAKARERGLIGETETIDLARATELLFHPGFSTVGHHERHLRPRRRHGRRAGRDPRARRRGHADLRAGPGHLRRDPPAADAGDHDRAARARRRPPVRDPAGPHRAHRAPARPPGPLGRRPPDARPLRRRAADRRRRRAVRRDAVRGRRVRGRRARQRRALAFAVSATDGQRELVTRPLPPEISDGSALSGAAVLSDGQIALIVDCDAIAENYTRARGAVA